MAQNNNIAQELNELNSNLANIGSQNVYAVPAGYFEGLAEQIMNRIKAMEASNAKDEIQILSPLLASVSKLMPYEVPSGYFEELEQTMIATNKNEVVQDPSEELHAISPFLGGLKKENPYTVPQGYFENLNVRPVKQEAKVVSITHRRWFKYAVAAVIIGIVAISSVMIFVNKPAQSGRSLAKFEKKLNMELKKMSDQELSDFIQYTDAGLTGEEKVSTNKNEEVKDMLKDVPDKELKEFLDETSDTETEPTMMN